MDYKPDKDRTDIQVKKMSTFVRFRFNQMSCVSSTDKLKSLRWLMQRCTDLSPKEIETLELETLLSLYCRIMNKNIQNTGFFLSSKKTENGWVFTITKNL